MSWFRLRRSIDLEGASVSAQSISGLAVLEAKVSALEGGAVIVSHDRRFLDRTVTEVVEIDEHDRGATRYAGGWAAYLEARDIAAGTSSRSSRSSE